MKIQRTIYYLGNKSRSANEIAAHCNNNCRSNGEYILDLFAGSGAVAASLSKTSSVVSNDIQLFSKKICEALLISSEDDSHFVRDIFLSPRVTENIKARTKRYDFYISAEREIAARTVNQEAETEVDRASLVSNLFAEADHEDPIIRTYGGVYFTIRDACILQVLLDEISTLSSGRRAVGEACVLSAASRSSVTVGNQFAQPQKFSHLNGAAKVGAAKVYLNALSKNPLEHALAATQIYPVRDRKSDKNYCVQGVDMDAAKTYASRAKLVYIDPPYGREHYSRFYHVLEDIALRRFAESADLKTRMRSDRFQSDYSVRTRAAKAFADVIGVCSREGTPIAVSYVDESRGSAVTNRIVTPDFLRSLIRESYAHLIEIPISDKNYSQLNRLNSADTRRSTEILLIGRN
jgi:adenine-specific DNA-methyltransferase